MKLRRPARHTTARAPKPDAERPSGTPGLDPQRVLDLLQEAKGPLMLEALQVRLGIARPLRPELRRLLKSMAQEGTIVRAGRAWRTPGVTEPRTGIFHGSPRGGGFVVPDDGGPSISVRDHRCGGALDRDRVKVVLLAGTSRFSPQGAIVGLVSRERKLVTGTFERRGHSGWLLPDDSRLPELMPVPVEEEQGAETGQAVVAEALTDGGYTRARIIEVLGEPGSAKVEEAKLVHLFGLRDAFPADAQAEAEALPPGGPAEVPGSAPRRDLTHLALVTIDPPDARDFDDAVHVEELPDGHWRLFVAIADVAHYVRPNSALDLEALSRGCSVYLPGRVLPMLPRRLSGDLCSLRPHEDRLVLAVELLLDAQGGWRTVWSGPATMRSRARLTYEGVAAVLLGHPLPDDPAAEHADQLRLLERLARILHRRRLAEGALDMELPEAKAVWSPDEQRVVAIERRQRNWAHRLVEEMMLIANRAVGARLNELGRGALWRIHEPPDPASLEDVAALALLLLPPTGPTPGAADHEPLQIGRMLRRFRGTPLEELLSQRLLRSLKQARYSEEDVGHFGLGTRGYLHFTSPIRRYPDLIVHRLLRGDPDPLGGHGLSELAELASVRERSAMGAEQAALQLHGALLLEPRVGERLPGTIAAITRAGLFVQLDEPFVQGLVLMGGLGDDYFELSPSGHEAVGRRTGRAFRLGDRLFVTVDAASPTRRQIDLRLD